MDDTRQFLTALYEGKPDAAWILIWAKKEKQKISRWAHDITEAVSAVAAANSEIGWDTYAGVCTSPKQYKANQRIPMAEVASLPGFWIDLDIAGEGHKDSKKKYPQSRAEALNLIAKIQVKPSLIVATGGGIHAYWLLKEHWEFTDPKEREKSANAMRAWVRTFQIYATAIGMSVDSVFDLARVLRVPGTANWKGATPRQCTIIELNDARYEASDLINCIPSEAYADTTAKSIVTKQAISVGDIILRPDATPNSDMLQALQLAEPKFDLSVKYQRKDFPKNDYSPSAYDMSLATYAALAEWPKQQIADLLLFVRRTHKQDLKLDNAQYYLRTIALAQSDAQRSRAVKELRGDTVHVIADPGAKVPPVTPQTATPGARDRALQFVSEALGIRIKDVIKYRQDPPKYRIVTGRTGIDLGTVENLIGQNTIRNALAATDSHYMPKMKSEDWEAIAQTLLNVCRSVSTGPESTDYGSIKEWLNVYFDENKPGALSDQSITNQQPHVEAEEICFYLANFRAWLYHRMNEKLTSKSLGIMLRKVRGRPAQIRHEVDEGGGNKRPTTRAVWMVPEKQINGREYQI